jgi:hypothetical protein
LLGDLGLVLQADFKKPRLQLPIFRLVVFKDLAEEVRQLLDPLMRNELLSDDVDVEQWHLELQGHGCAVLGKFDGCITVIFYEFVHYFFEVRRNVVYPTVVSHLVESVRQDEALERAIRVSELLLDKL